MQHVNQYRPSTSFAGGRNPWNPDMQAPVFTGPGTKPASKSSNRPASASQAVAKYRPRIDLSTLKIESGIPLPLHRQQEGKYSDVFAQLKPKDCITCKPDEVSAIANAMRKYLRDAKKLDKLCVVSVRTIPADPERGTEADPDHGRVWMWPKGETVDWLPAKSRGGTVLGQRRRAEKEQAK